MEFVTEYDHLCDACTRTLKQVAGMYEDDLLPDTDDPEAPMMYCYDHNLFCGGAYCRALPDGSRPDPGDKVMTRYGLATVVEWVSGLGEYELRLAHPRTGLKDADLVIQKPKALKMYHGDTPERGCPECGSTCGVPGCRVCAGEEPCNKHKEEAA